MITRAEQERLVRAWREAPDSANSPQVRDMVRAEVNRIDRAFSDLQRKIEVSFVDFDPYQSYEQMKADVLANKRMLVWTGASETPLWSPEVNWKARAVHDWDHIVHDVDFSIEGETEAYRHSAARTEGLAPLYLSEIVLQAAVQTFTGDFDEQKLVLPSDAVVKLVNSLRGGGSLGNPMVQRASMLVWMSAGMLRYMNAGELMVHLKFMGVPLDEAIIIVNAAEMLHERSL